MWKTAMSETWKSTPNVAIEGVGASCRDVRKLKVTDSGKRWMVGVFYTPPPSLQYKKS